MKPKPHPHRAEIVAFQQAHERYVSERRKREALERRRKKTRRLSQLRYLRKMPPLEFERLIAEMYRRLGYDVRETPASADGGVDGYLSKDGEKYILQCKRYTKPVGEATIRDLLGTVTHAQADGGILVTTSSFSEPARTFAKAVGRRVDIRLVDDNRLLRLLGQTFSDSALIPES